MIIPVILSGGSGSRLWPLSRETYPKQLLPLFGDYSLLQDTVRRSMKLANVSAPLIICNESHRFLVAEQLQEIEEMPLSIILEPIGRNTAPAIAMAAITALTHEEDPLLLILPSDHVIVDVERFCEVVIRSAKFAAEGKLITFGIVPTKPETGYGYIQSDKIYDDIAYTVKQFVEKPDFETAKQYVDSKKYYWNSGMFMFKAKTILAEMQKYEPSIIEACQATYQRRIEESDFCRLQKEDFGKCLSKSIDYAVMEKTSEALVVPFDGGWSDVGSWSALAELGESDDQGNVIHGNVICQNSSNCYLRSDKRLLAAIGLKDIVVIETSDAVLVTHKDCSQDVKGVVERLNRLNNEK